MSNLPHNPLSDNSTLVDVKGVSVNYGPLNVLDSVDLTIKSGEIVTLIGLNGSGKSTLVRTILGIIKFDAGVVKRKPNLRIGYSPQHVLRDPTMPMTVERFLTLGAASSRKRIREVLDEVGAQTIFWHPISDISGGEMQRVLLARALLREPELLVLDEPLSGVDIAGQGELYKLIARVRDRYGCGVLLVSHDLHIVMAATDVVFCLNRHICCTGQPKAVLHNPEFISLFGKEMAQTLSIYQHSHNHRHDSLSKSSLLETDSEILG